MLAVLLLLVLLLLVLVLVLGISRVELSVSTSPPLPPPVAASSPVQPSELQRDLRGVSLLQQGRRWALEVTLKVTLRRPLLPHLLAFPLAAHHRENGGVGDEWKREASRRTAASRRPAAPHSSQWGRRGLLQGGPGWGAWTGVLQVGMVPLPQLQSVQSPLALWNLTIGSV